MAPIIQPNIGWHRHHTFQSVLTDEMGGAALSRFNPDGTPAADADLRFCCPFKGTEAVNFSTLQNYDPYNPAARGVFLSVDDPTMISYGPWTISFLATANNLLMQAGSLCRYGLEYTLAPWFSTRNTLWDIRWKRGGPGAGSSASPSVLYTTWETGVSATPSVRLVERVHSVGFDEAQAGLWTIIWDGTTLEVYCNAMCVTKTTKRWSGDVIGAGAPSWTADLVAATGGTSSFCRFFVGECFSGAIWSWAYAKRVLTGRAAAVGDVATGEILQLYQETLEPIFGARR